MKEGEAGIPGIGQGREMAHTVSDRIVSDVMSTSKAKTGNFFMKYEETIPKSSWMRPLSLWRVGSLGVVFMDTGYGEVGGVGKGCVARVG